MVVLRNKEIRNLSKEELNKKLKELKIELIKSNSQKSTQGAALKTKEIKKAISKILTHTNTLK